MSKIVEETIEAIKDLSSTFPEDEILMVFTNKAYEKYHSQFGIGILSSIKCILKDDEQINDTGGIILIPTSKQARDYYWNRYASVKR